MLTSADMGLSAEKKWLYAAYSLNAISLEKATEALGKLDPQTISSEQQIKTLDLILDDLHHSNRSDIALEVLKKVSQEVSVSLLSKRLNPGSPTVIPQNALSLSIQLGSRVKGLESKLIEYLEYPYIDFQHRHKVAEALCSIQKKKIKKINFKNEKIIIRCHPAFIEKIECGPQPCQK